MATRIAFMLLLMSSSAFGGGPLFRHSEGKTDQEFENVYHELRTAGGIPVRTKTQLQSLSPGKAGLPFYCSDCSTDALVISTGTAKAAFGRVHDRTASIN